MNSSISMARRSGPPSTRTSREPSSSPPPLSARKNFLQTAITDKNHEDEAAANLLARIGAIPGTTITFDALHTRGETHDVVVVENKADYFCVLKKNTKTVLNRVESLANRRVDDTAETFDIGHGRAEKRRVEMLFTTPAEVGYAHGHACGRITRTREQIREGEVRETKEETEYFIASHKDARQRGARFFLDVAREHWAIENKLHHVKDRSMDEDRIRMGGAYARIKAGIQSMAAVTFSDIKGSTNCIQRRIASKPKILMGLMACKSLPKWVLEFL